MRQRSEPSAVGDELRDVVDHVFALFAFPRELLAHGEAELLWREHEQVLERVVDGLVRDGQFGRAGLLFRRLLKPFEQGRVRVRLEEIVRGARERERGADEPSAVGRAGEADSSGRVGMVEGFGQFGPQHFFGHRRFGALGQELRERGVHWLFFQLFHVVVDRLDGPQDHRRSRLVRLHVLRNLEHL